MDDLQENNSLNFPQDELLSAWINSSGRLYAQRASLAHTWLCLHFYESDCQGQLLDFPSRAQWWRAIRGLWEQREGLLILKCMAPNLTPDVERTNRLKPVHCNLSGIIGHDSMRVWVNPIIIRHWNVCKIPMNGISKKIVSTLFSYKITILELCPFLQLTLV